MIWILIIVFLLGSSFGGLMLKLSDKPNPVGVLRIDSSDPYDGPHLFLELHRNPENIKFEKYVTLQVNAENYISQQ